MTFNYTACLGPKGCFFFNLQQKKPQLRALVETGLCYYVMCNNPLELIRSRDTLQLKTGPGLLTV